MKKKNLLFFLCLMAGSLSQAQIWDGSTNTNWNEPTNWSTNAVPLAAGSVTIPITANKPALAGNVIIANFNMTAGSGLNFNGFTLSVTAATSIAGATLTNSNGSTDIVLSINSAGGAGTNYIGGTTFSDNATINCNGTGTTYEGYTTGNIYNGNTIFNLNGTGYFYSSYSQKSSFGGNLTVTRTGVGNTELFNSGFNFITGNFSYTNNAGGNTFINNSNVLSGPINGTVNITAAGAGNPSFYLKKIKNLTGGGTISVQNSGYTLIQNDTLTVTTINISGFTGGNSDDFSNNLITGNLTFAEGATNTGSVYTGNNTINGSTTLGLNSAATWYEGYQVGNVYNGNTSFSLNGTGTFNSSYSTKCSFTGNLSVNRTAAGITDLFGAGFNFITGNFSFSNTAGGHTYINSSNVLNGPINGTINITATGAGNPNFYLKRIKNLTTGGAISVQNSGYTLIQNDTLTVTAINVSGFTGGNSDDLSGCLLTGNLTFAEGATNNGSVYVGSSTFNGNTSLVTNSPTTTWYEGYQVGNVYNGNTSFSLNGSGSFNSSYSTKCSFTGNLTVNRTGAGTTDLFGTGFNFITGNFNFSNTVGGNTFINSSNVLNGPINGTVNITATGSGNPSFYLRKIKNLTGGGTISVQNSGYTLIQNDTLNVNTVNINGFTGGSSDEMSGNVITGNVTFADAATNTGSVYVGNNNIGGNTILSTNSASVWYESYSSSDTYFGNVTFNRNGTGPLYLSYSDTTYARQNLTINSNAGIDINSSIEFTGSANSTIEQLGAQPIIMPRLIIRKTGTGSLTLEDSVTVTTTASFISGNINTSIGKELIFPNNITYTGASTASHVVGPVVKIGDDTFVFPVGGPTSLNTVAMSAPVGAASRFTASYINQNPGSNGYNTALKAGSFGAAAISQAGYWDVQRLTGVTNVTLTLGFGTNPYEQYSNLANLKVAHWNGAQWDDHGNGGTTGTSASGTVLNSIPITSFSPFTIAGVTSTYFYVYGTPGAGPDGTPVKFKGTGGYPPYNTKQLPAGSYTADSIYLVPNGTSASFKLRDVYNVEKNDTTVTVAAAPTTYITANGNGTINFTGWRHFVYLKNGSNQIIGAVRDNNLTLGNTTMTAYFSTPNVATAPNGNIYLKRSFKVTSQFAPAGTKRVRFYILKTEYNNLVAADPTSFPNGINSLTITKYTGSQEDSLFNPIPGGNSSIIPNSDITIVDMGTMYSLDIDVSDFSGFYIGGNQANVSICAGSTISVPSNVSGATYQWQVNTGSGFSNISNGAVYGGVTTKTLALTNTPSSYYGYQYRAFVNGSTYSQVYTVKFTATWQGTASNVWENTANWSCGILPDANTDVLLNAGKANYPQVGANTSVRTLKAAAGTSVIVKTGFNLTITK